MVLLKSNGTLFQLDITLGDWLTLDGTTLTKIQTSPMWPYTAGSNLLTDAQVALPSFGRDMPGEYLHPRYGFTNHWLKYVQNRASAGQAPSGSGGPGPNLGPDVAMSSPSFNTGGHYSWQLMDTCTTRSDERNNLRIAKPDGSFNTAGGSPNLRTSEKCSRDCFCQWSTVTSATLNSTCDNDAGLAFYSTLTIGSVSLSTTLSS